MLTLYIAGASNNSTTGNVARKYYIEITPQSWTFGFCWAIIYSWLVLQLFYIVSTIFRRGLYGDFLYVTPPLITPVFYVALCVNLICNTLWLVLWARELILVCLFIIIGAAVTVYIPIVSCAYRTVKYEEEMVDGGCKKDIWMVRVLIQNGLGFYAAWLSIAWLLNLAIVIAYKNNIDQSIASTTSLILLGVELATYFILDIFVINKYTHYIVSPYITAMLALAGSMDKNWDATKSNSINTAALFGIACIGLIVKLVTIFVAPEVKKRIGKNQVWNVKA